MIATKSIDLKIRYAIEKLWRGGGWQGRGGGEEGACVVLARSINQGKGALPRQGLVVVVDVDDAVRVESLRGRLA